MVFFLTKHDTPNEPRHRKQTFDSSYETFAPQTTPLLSPSACFFIALATSAVFPNKFMPIYLHFMQKLIGEEKNSVTGSSASTARLKKTG